MRLTSVRRTVISILGFVMLGALAGLLGIWFNDSTSAAAQMPPLNTLETNKDANGFIRVHEQGTVPVTGTVNVGNTPAVQTVHVNNASLAVTGSVSVDNFPASLPGGVTKFFQKEVYPFDAEQTLDIDIHEYSRVRVYFVVNGSNSTVDFVWATNAGLSGDFSLDTGEINSVLLPEVAGTNLKVYLSDPDGEQVFVTCYGSN